MSTTENASLGPPPSTVSNDQQLLWHILYYGLAVFCGILNLLVIFVIPLDSKLRRRVTNWFLWTISVAYLVCAFLVTPFSFKSKIYWAFDPIWAPWICQTRPIVMMSAYNIEILLLLSLAVRYLVDFRNLQKDLRLTYFGGFFVVIIVILVSIALSFPWGFYRKIEPVLNLKGEILYNACQAPKYRNWKLYNDLVAFAGGAITVIVTDVLFVVVAVKAWRSVQAFPDAKTELKLLISILIKFNILWLPTIVLFSIKSIDKLTGNQTIPRSVALTLSLSNGLWHDSVGLFNPIIFLINVNYRRAYQRFLTCKCGEDQRLDYSWSNDIRLEIPNKPRAF